MFIKYVCNHKTYGCFCSPTDYDNTWLNPLPWNSFVFGLQCQLGYLQGCFRICNWFSLRWMVLRINNSPPPSPCILVCKLDMMETYFYSSGKRDVLIVRLLPHKFYRLFYFYLHPSISFQVESIIFLFIFHWLVIPIDNTKSVIAN